MRIPWSKLFADVHWPDSAWFPSQHCLFGWTHREICVCHQTAFPDCYSHQPHWLLWLQTFPPVSVDSLLGFSASFNCIRCSPEFRDEVRKYFLKLKQLRIYIKYVKLGGKISRALCLLLFSLEKSAHSLILSFSTHFLLGARPEMHLPLLTKGLVLEWKGHCFVTSHSHLADTLHISFWEFYNLLKVFFLPSGLSSESGNTKAVCMMNPKP